MSARKKAGPRRYAQDTKTPIHKTQGEIKAELKKLGAGSIGVLEGERESMVVFIVRDIRYMIRTTATTSDQETMATCAGLVCWSRPSASPS